MSSVQLYIFIIRTETLHPEDSIYAALSSLPLFNLACGENGITPDFDWKHVLKRFRNTAIRQKGFSLDGRAVSTAILREHLKSLGTMTDITIDTLLAPNDKQDVVLMIKLLYSISQLMSSPITTDPLARSTREILRLLGALYGHLLNAYLDTSLSLHNQLVNLSAAAHIILALYHKDKGNFIPVQSYFDVMCMIKNVYFCVAKAQRDNPAGRFFIVLLGTDGLEKVFGKVRTMVGNDTNADVLQLANRIDGAVQCVNILELHPEWGGDARRLKVKPIQDKNIEITSKYDHLNPAAFTGDLSVSSVVLLSSWNEGRSTAESTLSKFGITPPFAQMEKDGGYDILCPLGKGKMVLIGGLQSGERDETEEELDNPVANPDSALDFPLADDDEFQPDVDDLAGIAATAATAASSAAKPPPAYIGIDPNNPSSKPVHKSSILRLYSSPLTINESRDRLKRVRGYSRYDEVKCDINNATPAENDEDTLDIQDPAFTLVQCDKNVFLAVFQVLGIRHDGKDLSSISSNLLHEPNVRIHGQIMKLRLIQFDASREVSVNSADWEWDGTFESQGVLRDINGRFVSQVDPHLQPASQGRNTNKNTYAFKTSELRSIAAVMYERLEKETFSKVAITDSFPYRIENGNSNRLCNPQ